MQRLLESVARIKAGQTTKRNLINDCQTNKQRNKKEAQENVALSWDDHALG